MKSRLTLLVAVIAIFALPAPSDAADLAPDLAPPSPVLQAEMTNEAMHLLRRWESKGFSLFDPEVTWSVMSESFGIGAIEFNDGYRAATVVCTVFTAQADCSNLIQWGREGMKCYNTRGGNVADVDAERLGLIESDGCSAGYRRWLSNGRVNSIVRRNRDLERGIKKANRATKRCPEDTFKKLARCFEKSNRRHYDRPARALSRVALDARDAVSWSECTPALTRIATYVKRSREALRAAARAVRKGDLYRTNRAMRRQRAAGKRLRRTVATIPDLCRP